MSSLYEDPQWSEHADTAASAALRSMSEGEGASFTECVEWLRGRHKEGDLSLSDVWGVFVSRIKGVPVSILVQLCCFLNGPKSSQRAHKCSQSQQSGYHNPARKKT